MNKYLKYFMVLTLFSCALHPQPQVEPSPNSLNAILGMLNDISNQPSSEPTETIVMLDVAPLDEPLMKTIQKEHNFKKGLKEQESVSIEFPDGTCSGVFIAHNIILTASHCVTSNDITVHCRDDDSSAKLVRYDHDSDLAVLKLDSDCDIKPTRIAKKEPVPFDHIFSIGCPGSAGCGFANEGVVGKYRDKGKKRLMVSSMQIWFGNSGGQVLDKHGELVGITSAMSCFKHDDHSQLCYSLHVPVQQINNFLKNPQTFSKIRLHLKEES